MHSALDNTPPHFVWYGKRPRIHKLRTFGCAIYSINSSPKDLDNRTQQVSFMGYTNSRPTMKRWDLHNKKLEYCSSGIFDKHNNKFGKGWSPGSELMIGTNIYYLTALKNDLSEHPFIKYDTFEVNVTFPLRGTPIGIVSQYCENHNMYYVSQSKNNIPRKQASTERNITNVCILSIGRKLPKTVP